MNTPTSEEMVRDVLNGADCNALADFAEMIRSTCLRMVANAEIKLDPTAMREINATVKRIKAMR